jgi:hypothetical protein
MAGSGGGVPGRAGRQEKIDHALDTPATACFDAFDRNVQTGA